MTSNATEDRDAQGDDRLMTPVEVIAWIKERAQHTISLPTLDRWRRAGLIKHIKVGRAVRFRLVDVRNLLAERKP